MTEKQPSDTFKPDAQLLRKIDTLTDEIHFRETLDLASRVCLGRKFTPTPYETELTADQKLLANLGATGLRNAIDAPKDRYFSANNADIALRGDSINDAPNLALAHEARQFGQELLNEAYRCLGQEVHDKIREYRVATSDNERHATLEWVAKRLNVIAHSNNADIEDPDAAEGFYHPIRLSLRAIGAYPNIEITPTCLSVSTIAASFLEQTGAPHLHAGLMATRAREELRAGAVSLLSSKYDLEDFFLNTAYTTDKAITDAAQISTEWHDSYAHEPEAFHSANLVKMDNVWHVLDANFSILDRYHGNDNTQLDDIYASLQEFETSAPGLERTFKSTEIKPIISEESIFSSIGDTSREHFAQLNSASHEQLVDILRHETESIYQKLYDATAAGLRPIIEASSLPEESKQLYLQAFDRMAIDAFAAFAHVLIFSNGQITATQARARQDAAFAARLTTDLRKAWQFVAIAVSEETAAQAAKLQMNSTHPMLEVGLPAQRIGFSVLKEFDTYTDSAVSPSFWLSNWSSHIAITNAVAQASERPGQAEITAANVLTVCSSDLHYMKDVSIIEEFAKDAISTLQGEDDVQDKAPGAGKGHQQTE